MESLYTVANEFAELFDSYESISDMEFTTDGKGGFIDDDGAPVDPDEVKAEMQQAWFDTLDAMECEITDKAKNIALYIKNITAEANAVEAEKKRLDVRLKTKRNTADRLKKYLLDCLETANLKKIDCPEVMISVRNNPEATVISDTDKFIEWAMNNNDELLKYSKPEINKTAVKQCIKNGVDIPFAELTRTRSVVIK